ncbi:hypothetical protein LXL04_016999 [Taraxacum kok-saghyz]
MKKTASRIFALMEKNTQLVDVLVDKKPACVMEMVTSQITNIPTLQQPLKETLGMLCNKEVSGIGIYGLVGSGKRIIMQNLNNHIKVAKMFDIVILVSVSRKGSMKHRDINQIQQDIVERLELDIGVTSNVDLIANRIRVKLTNIKYLLLLEDVNEDLNLDIIGVPKSENGSKIRGGQWRHSGGQLATKAVGITGDVEGRKMGLMWHFFELVVAATMAALPKAVKMVVKAEEVEKEKGREREGEGLTGNKGSSLHSGRRKPPLAAIFFFLFRPVSY